MIPMAAVRIETADSMQKLTWKYAADSNIGRVREKNEDALVASPATGVFVVADGMGGHAAGEVASEMASRTVALRMEALRSAATAGEVRQLVLDAIEEANRKIVVDSRNHPGREGMGTTLTALVLRPEGRYVVGHVGDSRMYMSRSGELRRITEDHTYVQQLVNRGRLTEEQARNHPRANLLTRALGTDEVVEVDIYEGDLTPGDRLVLTSDGLTGMISDTTLEEIMGRSDDKPSQIVERLIEAANEGGGKDNITAILIEIAAVES